MATASDRPIVGSATQRLTAADLAALPAELPSGTVWYELDNGRLLTMAPPGDVHGSVQANLSAELVLQGQRRGFGKARSKVGIMLWRNPDRVVGADAAFITTASLPLKRSPEGYLETVPELVVEVQSENDTLDYIQRKVQDYLAAGVKSVWVADPQTKSIAVHGPGASTQTLSHSST